MKLKWPQDLKDRNDHLYLAIVDALAEEISTGKLPPRFRLPTHRELADELGVAIGTVTRAYAEAENRGLIHGDGRRGTFVGKAPDAKSMLSSLLESDSHVIDFSKNYPTSGEDPDISTVLQLLTRQPETQRLLRYPTAFGYHRHRAAGAKWIADLGMKVDPDAVIVTNGAQHALTIIFIALSEPGDTILTDEHTYPGIKAIAEMLRLRLVGVPMDGNGPLPDAMESICLRKKVRALYCNPTLHNPTNTIISEDRRREIAAMAEKYGFAIVEDEILRRLVPTPPPLISGIIPDRSYLVASVSKVIAGGLRVGFINSPPDTRQRLIDTLRSVNLMVAPLPVEILATWIENGTSDKIVANRRGEARARQKLAGEVLKSNSLSVNPMSYHVWLHLPDGWTSADFTMEAHHRGVAVAPAEVFAVDKGRSANAVRLCLGAVANRQVLKTGLEVVAEMLTGTRQHFSGTI